MSDFPFRHHNGYLKNKIGSTIYFLLIIFVTSACSNNIDYTPPPGSTETAITHYSFGNMVISGKTYHSDLVILPGGSVSDWSFDLSTHEITPDDLNGFISDQVKTIIIGTGNMGVAKLSESAKDAIEKMKAKGIMVHVLKSGKAAKLYNTSSKEGLIAFFHLNC